MHEDLSRGQEVAGSSDRAFGLVFAAVFSVVALWPVTRGGESNLFALGAAGGFLGLALLRPAVLAPLNRAWLRFGALLHRLISPVVLALIFFAVLTPIALLMRAVGSRPLSLGIDRAAPTYWTVREPAGPAPETITRQF